MTLRPPATQSPSALESLRLAALAVKRLERSELAVVIDPAFPKSRAAPHQDAFFRDAGRYPFRIIRAGNQSAKSTTGLRDLTYVMTGTHPHWRRPTASACPCCRSAPVSKEENGDLTCANEHTWRDWGTGALTAIVAGQSYTSMEEELWRNKMKPFFGPEWKEFHKGGQLKKVENVRTGDRILFLSHADSSEQNRKYLQSFVAHYVYLDEMPTSVAIFEELQRRVDARRGYFTAGFTPKVYSGAVRRWVDNLEAPTGLVYRFSKFQNPLFKGKEAEERAKLKGLPEHYVKCVLFGDWMPGDGLVFWFEPDLHGAARHPGYDKSWAHVLVVDPATESKLGFLMAYRIPESAAVLQGHPPPGSWVVYRAFYVEGVYTPTKIVAHVEALAAEGAPNLIERVSDPAATWYIRQASDMPAPHPSVQYSGVYGKNVDGRKDSMLAASQQALGQNVWVELNDETVFLQDEFGSMVRSPDTGQIRKAKRFHLIDSFNYFVDRLPFDSATPMVQGLTAQQQAFHAYHVARDADPTTELPKDLEAVAELDAALANFRIQVSGPLSGFRR